MTTISALPAPQAEELAWRLRRAVVAVASGAGSGAGTAWRYPGLIVTNSHVVHGPQARVETSDSGRLVAELIARDAGHDLALLWAEGAALEPLAVRPAGSLRPGELVFASGNPWGERGVMTAGVVGATPATGHRIEGVPPGAVLSDARLRPGNSGGPLVDASGRVVGINTMVAGGLAVAIGSETVEAFLRAALARWQRTLRKAAV